MQQARAPIQPIQRLADVAGAYDALFCDVWGVVHDGVKKSPAAEAALIAARKAGVRVVLLTNSPRLSGDVIAQLDLLTVSREAYDTVVTSGDATQALIAAGPRRIFHIGPSRDTNIFDGLGVELVGEAEADGIVATGLFDDEAETPSDYAQMLARMNARGLPMICANPDIVVHRGANLIYCAGALAQAYDTLGGRSLLAGKPHAPIYAVARERAGVEPGRVLCIGDGLFTDIKGARDFGADALFVVEGIHGAELGHLTLDGAALAEEVGQRGLSARYAIATLS